jgi:tRNA dimethylallyltransferase
LNPQSAIRNPRSRIFITGPTASGKGAVAHQLARKIGGEIVAVDSMKIYREMDVGTAKPAASLRAEVPYHLIDFVDPGEDFSVGQYLPMALRAVEEIEGRGRPAILCGGTALYLNALVNGLVSAPSADWDLRRRLIAEGESQGAAALHARLRERDPAAAGKIDPHDLRRIVRALEVHQVTGQPISEVWKGTSPGLDPGSYLLVGISWDRETLYRRIDERVLRMVCDGLFEEVLRLASRQIRNPQSTIRNPPLGRAAAQCIGYKEILAGEKTGSPREDVIATIQRRTRRFAKQQLTWFRRFPIRWLPAEEGSTAESLTDEILKLL